MCGLAGNYNFSSSDSFTAEVFNSIQQALSHRGPNGYRVWISPDKKLRLMHRRLSIVDLSDNGFQPMFNDDQSIVVMCNGEIYNHPSLKKELEALGYHYKSQSDTETILHAYEEWGIKFLDRINGMFSIAIWDARSQELFLIRDRMGIKPLYFSLENNALSFASEIKALWHMPAISKEINPLGLYHYLTYLVTPAPLTLYKNIYKLPAGHYIHVDKNYMVRFQEWYNPIKQSIGQVHHDETKLIQDIRFLLDQSIKEQMMSDVPYGVFLSGGIDSSLNVALMSKYTDRVNTFTVAFSDGPEYDELRWAKKVSDYFNTNHHEIIIDEQDAFNFFERMVYHQDEPLADCVCIPLYYVAHLLKNNGVTVVQVGEGSDELFCGYTTYANYVDFYNRYWKPSQRLFPHFTKKIIANIFGNLFPTKINHHAILNHWANNKNLFWSGAIAFPEITKKSFIKTINNDYHFDPILEKIYPGFSQEIDSYTIVDYHLKQLYKELPNADFLQSLIYLELKHRLPELLLMRVDKMTMATAVEGRVPFLDHRLVELALQIPSTLKYKNGITKYILKKAAEEILPNEIIYRKKMGFAAPTKRWFKEGKYFKPYFMDLLHSKKGSAEEYLNINAIADLIKNNEQGNEDHSVQLWTLQNLIASL